MSYLRNGANVNKSWEILKGDCREILADMPDNSVDSVVTDPPSGTNLMIPFRESSDTDRYVRFDCPLGKLRANFKTTYSVNMRLRNIFEENIWPALLEVGRVMKPGSYGVFWGFPRSAHWLSYGLEEAGLSVLDTLIRRLRKRRPKSPLIDDKFSTQLVQETEHWVLVRKDGNETARSTFDEWGTGYMNVFREGTRISNLWESYPSHGSESDHPTEKPVPLMEEMVRLVTPEGGIVLDPFAGSGSTLLAADRVGRESIGIELNPEYVEIAEKRLKDSRRERFTPLDDEYIEYTEDETDIPDEMELDELFDLG